VTSRKRPCYLFSMRLGLALTVLLALGGLARAEESQPRSIRLVCKAPANWPARTATMRLTCRLDSGTSGPAFWQTLNPFAPTSDRLALVDPFEVEATAHLVDPFANAQAHQRLPRLLPPLDLPSATIDPFQGSPAPAPAR
jgi:hypothetical protein